MARSQVQYLADIDEAMMDVRQFARGRTLAEFREDRQLRYAIERALEIIGEAAGNLSDEVTNQAPGVPWREMRGLRNIVAHAYHRVDAARVWQVVTKDLAEIHPDVKKLLSDVKHGPSAS